MPWGIRDSGLRGDLSRRLLLGDGVLGSGGLIVVVLSDSGLRGDLSRRLLLGDGVLGSGGLIVVVLIVIVHVRTEGLIVVVLIAIVRTALISEARLMTLISWLVHVVRTALISEARLMTLISWLVHARRIFDAQMSMDSWRINDRVVNSWRLMDSTDFQELGEFIRQPNFIQFRQLSVNLPSLNHVPKSLTVFPVAGQPDHISAESALSQACPEAPANRTQAGVLQLQVRLQQPLGLLVQHCQHFVALDHRLVLEQGLRIGLNPEEANHFVHQVPMIGQHVCGQHDPNACDDGLSQLRAQIQHENGAPARTISSAAPDLRRDCANVNAWQCHSA